MAVMSVITSRFCCCCVDGNFCVMHVSDVSFVHPEMREISSNMTVYVLSLNVLYVLRKYMFLVKLRLANFEFSCYFVAVCLHPNTNLRYLKEKEIWHL